MRNWWAAAAAGVIFVVACAGRSGAPEPSVTAAASGRTTSAPTPSPAIAVSMARYGSLAFTAVAGANCGVDISAPKGAVGEAPPAHIDGRADAGGLFSASYSAPRIPAGTGTYRISCSAPGYSSILATASFEVPSRAIAASSFLVRVVSDDGANGPPDPSLVARRDAIAPKLRSSLAQEWSLATRGLSQLTVVDESADIVITVIAQRGTSVNRSFGDLSEDVLLYVAVGLSVLTPENAVAVAMHELGHIWCCSGPGTNDGHWSVPQADPLLGGIDKYGLMNHPVNCVIFQSGLESCPNRFSERELRAMGFAQIPAPPADPCLAQFAGLQSQVAALRGRLSTLDAQLADTRATVADLKRRIQAIESQYPNGIPPSIYPSYSALVDQHNALVVQGQAQVDSYNALITQENGIVRQINALPCRT